MLSSIFYFKHSGFSSLSIEIVVKPGDVYNHINNRNSWLKIGYLFCFNWLAIFFFFFHLIFFSISLWLQKEEYNFSLYRESEKIWNGKRQCLILWPSICEQRIKEQIYNPLGIKLITIKRKTSCNIKSKKMLIMPLSLVLNSAPRVKSAWRMLKHFPIMRQKNVSQEILGTRIQPQNHIACRMCPNSTVSHCTKLIQAIFFLHEI